MSTSNNIELKEITTYEEAEQAILCFKDSYYLRAVTNDENRKSFIEKHLKFGHMIAEYHDETAVGFASFYCNDKETKKVFVSSFALSENLGFLKGKTLIRLLNLGFEISQKAGMEIVRLEVEKDNAKAIKLYKHFGFEEVPADSEKENSFYMEMKLANYKY